MCCTITAPVKNEDDGDQEMASLICDQRLVPLGGHGDRRASLACDQCMVPLGGHGDSRVSLTYDQQACGHLLDTQQERPLLIWAWESRSSSRQNRGGGLSWRDVVKAGADR